jgi:flagellar hook assembly protein FlgD
VLPYDGVYRLRVQASDKSKNESGDIDYQISFEVINRSTITNLLNYPNPFTTSTRFVFVLTGSKIPDQMQIQIMTITGKLVKTIDAYDIGPIRIGRNITEYAWDGNDDYGDRLANGVYLYRVKAKIDGENIEHRPTSADKYFKKGFGKLYLMK